MKISKHLHSLGILMILVLPVAVVCGQQNDSSKNEKIAVDRISEKSLRFINSKYDFLQQTIQNKSEKILTRMMEREQRLQNALATKDSLKAKELFANAKVKYQQILAKLKSPINATISNPLKEYLPGIDSMQTAMQFLEQNGLNIPGAKLQQIQAIQQQIQQLQGKLQEANNVQDFVRQREQQLRAQLAHYGLATNLASLNREVYFYQEQLAQYKDMINNKEKLETLAMGIVTRTPAFGQFMQKNSILSKFFPMPENYGTPQAIQGLQTKAQIQAILNQKKASISASSGAGGGGAASIQTQVQQAQTMLNQVKNRVSQLGFNSGIGDMTMPQFTPNTQRTKSFLKRIEYGITMQSIPATPISPVIQSIIFSVGYKASDKVVFGGSVNYNMGLGRSIEKIRITNQGAGVGSFLDIKAKGGLWISARFEDNYLQQFSSIANLSTPTSGNLLIISPWQRSALIGLSKKYSVGKMHARMQLYYDLLYQQEWPRTGPIKFRFGYSF